MNNLRNIFVSASMTLSTLASCTFTLFPNPTPRRHHTSYRHLQSGPCLKLYTSQIFYFLTTFHASAPRYLHPRYAHSQPHKHLRAVILLATFCPCPAPTLTSLPSWASSKPHSRLYFLLLPSILMHHFPIYLLKPSS